jgi:hypothetical protein
MEHPEQTFDPQYCYYCKCEIHEDERIKKLRKSIYHYECWVLMKTDVEELDF